MSGAIHLDNEIVATAFDDATGDCRYTLERGGKRWTVTVHIDHLNAHGANVKARREHLAKVLATAMMGPADE